MLSKLIDFDRFFARRVVPVVIALIVTAVISVWMDLSSTADHVSKEAISVKNVPVPGS